MSAPRRAVILVGHGGVPKDVPRDLVLQLKRLESERRAADRPRSAEERKLDSRIRHWPRTPATDPYAAGLESLAARLRPRLDGARLAIAYNEYCAPSLEQAVDTLAGEGITEISIVTTMFTPGGSHSEIEIPESVAALQQKHPGLKLHYAWPYDLDLVAGMIAEHVNNRTGTGD